MPESVPHSLPLDLAFHAAFLLADRYLSLERNPDDGLVLFHQYLQSDPARWQDWMETVQKAVADEGIDPLVENLARGRLEDLARLPDPVRQAARVQSNGEVLWSVSDVAVAIRSLADAGLVILGTDVRDYDADGRFTEIAWSDHDGTDLVEARDAALAAVQSENLPSNWVLVTWWLPAADSLL